MDARLIDSPPLDGAMNMALDECLLASAANGQTTLRLYRWSEATLSLGYFQRQAEQAENAPLKNLPLVRRASGGGAIVHHHELTYSFAAPGRGGEPLYLRFHETLIEAFRGFGIEADLYRRTAEAANSNPPDSPPFLCFDRRAEQDLVVGKAKVVGSAQRKLKTAVLQHGSILLAASPFTPHLLGLDAFATRPLNSRLLIEAWLPHLAKHLGLSWKTADASASELVQAEQIRADKFASEGWNTRR